MTPLALPDWRPRKTLIDLYNEKNETPWYYTLGARLSALMLAVGFFISSSTLIPSYHSTATPTPLLVNALLPVVLAYPIFAFIFMFTRSWIFQLDILCVPHLSSSILGLISIIYALSAHGDALSAGTSTAHFAVSVLVLSVISIVVFFILFALVFRKIYIVRASDAMYRSISKTGPRREDEEQRQQLSRLLLQQDEKTATSPGSGTQTTFKLDWPGHSKATSRRSSVSVPQVAPGFASMSSLNGRESQIPGPSDHPPRSIGRLPSISVQEPSRFSSWFNPRSDSTYDAPANHLTGGIERFLTMDQRASLETSTQLSISGDDGPAPLRPIAYVPPSQNFRYFGLDSPTQPGTPQSALPSYSADAHPSMNISTRPISHVAEIVFPNEKEEPSVYALPAPAQQRPIQEGPYRMADQD